MKVLIRNATIHSPSSPLNGQSTDILLENGIITAIANDIQNGHDQLIEFKNLHVSEGWMDCFANFCDPGDEYKEDLLTGTNAAASGGYTTVMLLPNTNPVVNNKSQVEYLMQKGKTLASTIHPMGAITKNTEGNELTEMYDMHYSGAIAFTDGTNAVQSSGILLKALQYITAIDGIIIQMPDDKSMSANGQMNEGITSTKLGLPGKPAIAEELQIARDIELAKYTGSKIHFTGISTKRSLQLIKNAKSEGLHVSCSVTPYHLFFCDEDLSDYDTNLKVNPPLRTKEDMFGLREGFKTGSIDFVASHHQPQDWDNKTCEFEYAKNGMTGLESVFGVIGLCGLDQEQFIKMQTETIRKIFNLPFPEIKIGSKANLTLFDPNGEYIFTDQHIFSKSKNNPFIGKKLKGQTFGIINGDKVFLSGGYN